MKHLLACTLCLSPLPASADMQTARDALQTGNFDTVKQELQTPANSGNAEAEHLLAFLYDTGHGVAQSSQRAFDLYLRSATKGYPPAQKALSLAYATGRGLPAPDPLRAYVWIKLAALADAPNITAKAAQLRAALTQPQQNQADELVNDYHALFFPFAPD